MRILEWLKAARAPFFLDVMFCVCLGAAAAWHETGSFEVLLLVACLVGVVFLNAGTNLSNDYYDHTSGADEANPDPTPFSGGSRAIQEGRFSARTIRNAGFLSFALAAAVGAYIVWHLMTERRVAAWPVLAIGGVATFSGLFYTAPPFRLGYRGFGELLAGLNVGPLAILGSYYVQAGGLSWKVAVASIPLGLLSSALLVINEIPDAAADRSAGKNHLVTRVGPAFAAWAYLVLVVGAFAAAGVAVGLGAAPWTASLVFAAAPLGLLAFARARSAVRSEGWSATALVPAMGANVACLLLSGALLCVGYLVGGGPAA